MDATLIGKQTSGITIDQAFDYCAAITNSHYENFPVASLFLPEDKRPYIQAIYAFSRTADDFADELTRPEADRLADLDNWDDQLQRCYAGEASHPVFIALAETVRSMNIPIDPLRNLLVAFRRDVTQRRYETFEELLNYCTYSANPVGRLLLMVFGHRDEQLFILSDRICTALQLANFWQDISVDLAKDRLYIPQEDLRRFGYTEGEWKTMLFSKAFQSMMRFEVDRTLDLFIDGAELPSLVQKDIQIELKLVWLGGVSILRKIQRQRYNVYRRRPNLSSMNKLGILAKAFCVGNLARYGSKQKPKEPWDLT